MMQRDMQRSRGLLGNIGRYARQIAVYAKSQGPEQQDTFSRSFVQRHIQQRWQSMLPDVLCCVRQSRECWIEYPGAQYALRTSPAEEREHGSEDEEPDDGERVAIDASATGPVEQRQHGRTDEGGQ